MLASGRVIAERYRVVRFIAARGMGEVYEVEDLELHVRVALKTLLSGAATTLAPSRVSIVRWRTRGA
jgi:serine/threonine protein kinase